MPAAGADLATETAPVDHERVGERAVRRLLPPVGEQQAALELAVALQPAATLEPAVDQLELVDAPDPRGATF